MASADEKDTSKSLVIYTEDGVPVYTLYLGNIPRQKREVDIRNCFAKHGEVKSVTIIRKGGKPKNEATMFKYGFVTFAKAESAALALSNTDYKSISKRLKVRAADTWKQPQTTPNPEKKEIVSDETSDKVAPVQSILDLNDDCLLHLFSYLNSIDQLNLALICQRFHDITEHIIKVNKLFDFNAIRGKFTLMQIRQILSRYGPHIKKLHLEGGDLNYRRYLEFVPTYCPHIEELDFEMFRNIHYETYRRVFHSGKQLKSLKLNNCDINNRICALFGSLEHLERLNLSHNCDITGKYLSKLKNLIELDLSNCENVDTKFFIEICKKTQLKILNIVGCYQLNMNAFKAMVDTQDSLEQIMVSNSYHASNVGIISQLKNVKHIKIHREGGAYLATDILTDIAVHRKDVLESLETYNLLVTMEESNQNRILEFKNLKKLCLVRDKYLDNKFLLEITKHCKYLEEISICGATLVTDDGIVGVVENSKSLNIFDISFCEQFKENLYHQLIKILNGKRTTPLTLFVPETSIKRSILNTKKYKRNENLLILSFTIRHPFAIEDFDDSDLPSDDSFNDVLDYFNYSDSDDDDDFYLEVYQMSVKQGSVSSREARVVVFTDYSDTEKHIKFLNEKCTT